MEDTKKIPGRTPEGNKSTFGKVLAVAGSPGMCGAAYFCAAAAFAGGAGMVRILTDESNRIPLQSLLPEAIIDCGKGDRKSTRLNSSHIQKSRMPSSA